MAVAWPKPVMHMEGLRLRGQEPSSETCLSHSQARTGCRGPQAVPSSWWQPPASHSLPVSPSGSDTPIHHWVKIPGFLA